MPKTLKSQMQRIEISMFWGIYLQSCSQSSSGMNAEILYRCSKLRCSGFCVKHRSKAHVTKAVVVCYCRMSLVGVVLVVCLMTIADFPWDFYLYWRCVKNIRSKVIVKVICVKTLLTFIAPLCLTDSVGVCFCRCQLVTRLLFLSSVNGSAISIWLWIVYQ